MHVAAEGGSLALLRWLVDELGCPLYDEEDKPLRTQPRGDSVLGVAARRRHAHVMRWLVAAKHCKVAEIADRAQLVAAVEFLLLGDESGAGSCGRMLPMSGEGYAEGEEEVKQHEAFDYGSVGEDDEEEAWARQQLRQGHGFSATAAAAVKKKGKGKFTGNQQPEGASTGAVVDECLLCGVRTYVRTYVRPSAESSLGLCVVVFWVSGFHFSDTPTHNDIHPKQERAVDCLILPCGHICTCTGCGQGCRECPACRTRVKRVVRTACLES